MIYFAIYLYVLLLGLIFINSTSLSCNYRRNVKICFWIFVLIAGLRYEIGCDYFAYRKAFNESLTLFDLFASPISYFEELFNGSWEPGSILLFSIFHTVTDDAQIIFFVVSVICSVLLFKSLQHFCEPNYFFLSLLIYFCFVYMFQEMHALRQAFGACILYYGLYQLSIGSWRKSFFYVILSVFFHYSMALFVPFFFFMNKRINVKCQILLLGIAFVVFLFRIRWMAMIIDLLSSFFPTLGVMMKIISYTNMDEFERPFFITFILYMIPYIYILFRDSRSKAVQSQKYVIAKNMYFLYLILTMAFWEFSYFSIRYGWICLFGMAVCLPKLIDSFKSKSKFVPIGYVICFSYIIIRTFLFPDLTTSQFSPYENYVECKIFGREGTGRERTEKYAAENNFEIID